MTELSDKPAPAVQAARPAAAPPPVAAATAATVSPQVVPPVVPPPHVQVRPEPRRPGRFRRFVRSVFSHLMFAALVTAGVFGYVYQDMILGRVATTVCGNDALGPYTPGGSKAASATPAAKPATPVIAATPPLAATPAPAPVAVAAAPIQTPAPAPAPKTEAAPAAPAPSAAPPKAIEAKPAGPSPAADAPKAAETPKAAASVPAAGIVPPADKPQPAAPAAPAVTPPKPAASSPQDALTSAWRAAREAFNAGKPDAIDAYKSLLRTYPDVPDLAGELGNIYYAAGKWREAGETYYEAAQRYLKSPQPGYAACLLDVLRNLRSPEAERLAPQITRPCPAARSGQAGQTGETASTAPRG